MHAVMMLVGEREGRDDKTNYQLLTFSSMGFDF
jgi:hypothetical protein